MRELNRVKPVRLTAVGESTGPYWWHAFYQIGHDDELQPFSPTLALLNPSHVKRYRQALPEQDKADPDDARLIDQYYRSVGVKHPYQFHDRYLRLRTFSRYHTHHRLGQGLLAFHSLSLGQCLPVPGGKPFSNLFGATSQSLLEEFADIQAIADIPLGELTPLLVQRSGNTLLDPADNARKLHQTARHSFPIPAYLSEALHRVVQHTLAHISLLADNRQAYRQLIAQELDTLPEANLALAYKGLGPILVAGCLAEIQNTSRFVTGNKFDRRLKKRRPRSYRDGQAAVAKLWWRPSRTQVACKGFSLIWPVSATPICVTGLFRLPTLCSDINPTTTASTGKSIVRLILTITRGHLF